MSEDAELRAIASRRVGTVLHGKYHIDSVLGVGGMATVYAATHRNRKRFAVKLLHPEFSVRHDVRARFVREGYVANSVPHAGVVEVLDDDVDETGAAFLVMELLEGATVDALYTKGGPICVRDALSIADQLLDVLETAHRKSVVHRDIKPANLFILRDGQLKVLDFGIARLRDGSAGVQSTRSGLVLGTPAFMAPEQALAMPEHVDERTDVWAAGATLFTMLSASFVHPGVNARQIMIRAATDPARSIQSIMPELPASVAAVVARALAFERSERWPSAAAMREVVLGTFADLFGTSPVRADVAALVERTSATLGTQPTELDAPTESPHPVSVRRTPQPPEVVGNGARIRALETTMATPVGAPEPTPVRRAKRRFPAATSLVVAICGAGAFLAVHWETRTRSSPPEVLSQPAARPDTPPPSPKPVMTPEATTPVETVMAQAAFASSRALPAQAPSAPARPRTAPRKEPPRVAPPTDAAAPLPMSKPENPLKLKLQ